MRINFWLVVLFLFVSCREEIPYETKRIDLPVTEKFSIGSGISGSNLIYAAYDMSLGPDGNIFVADAGNLNVKVFSNTGSHLYSFGNRGRGPVLL